MAIKTWALESSCLCSNLALPLASCVALGKDFNLSVLWLPHL